MEHSGSACQLPCGRRFDRILNTTASGRIYRLTCTRQQRASKCDYFRMPRYPGTTLRVRREELGDIAGIRAAGEKWRRPNAGGDRRKARTGTRAPAGPRMLQKERDTAQVEKGFARPLGVDESVCLLAYPYIIYHLPEILLR